MPRHLSCATLSGLLLFAAAGAAPLRAEAQLVVHDPSNLVQNALNATRALEQVNNQVRQITNQLRQLENDARNLTRLGESLAPDLIARLREMEQLIAEAGGLALRVGETRASLETLYTGDYRNTDVATRAERAASQLDAARSALQRALLVQAEAAEAIVADQAILERLAAASSNAPGALAAQQSANEMLAFQAGQTLRLQQLLIAETRAEALARAREMEAQAQGRAQHEHFFSGARNAHAGERPWN